MNMEYLLVFLQIDIEKLHLILFLMARRNLKISPHLSLWHTY